MIILSFRGFLYIFSFYHVFNKLFYFFLKNSNFCIFLKNFEGIFKRKKMCLFVCASMATCMNDTKAWHHMKPSQGIISF